LRYLKYPVPSEILSVDRYVCFNCLINIYDVYITTHCILGIVVATLVLSIVNVITK
jgi:hypothetical protein